MTKFSSVSPKLPNLCQAIADQKHGQSLQLLQKLPLRNRWDTLFLLNRTFSQNKSKDYIRSLTHDLLYRAYREELAGHGDEASRLYRLLIQHNSGNKITQKARAGFKRIANGHPHTLSQLSPESTIIQQPAPPTSSPVSIANDETSLVLLEPVPSTEKQALALKLAPLLEMDPYTARLTLPSVEFRILRHGLAPDNNTLHQTLTAAGIINHHISLTAVQSVSIYDVLYIEAAAEKLIVQVRDPKFPSSSKPMEFGWSEIKQSVEGLLPLFEEVVDRTQKGKLIRKTATQDHAQIMDLHLQNHQGILRFYDAGYQFNQGMPLVETTTPRAALDAKTSWAQWQGLKQILKTHLQPIPEHHKFDHFATSTVEQIEILTKIESHIRLLRRHECYWDQAFHLYSALHYLRLS